MIGSAFKNQKDNVIDLYDGYKRIRGKDNDGINLEFLESRVNALINGKYTLAVAGEVNAGKSTFINALLGVELLPSDVLQSSSAIVEICKSNEPYLKVQYAAGNEIILNHGEMASDGDIFQRKIKEVCSINDKHRDLPTTLIDNYIIKSNNKIEVTDKLINILEQNSQLYLSDKQELLKEYIEKRSKDDIPIEIQIGFPLKWDFDQLRIVDSPGVNAVGGVQDISFEYFEEANAIIFINRIDPIESKSFRDFVNSVITERSKETLFLVLTHAGLKTDEDVIRLQTEAKRLYKNDISEEKILVVDSILKLIYNDIRNNISVEQIEESSPIKADILPKFQRKAEKQNSTLENILLQNSHFEELFDTIDRFSLQAPSLQLIEIMEKIKEGYNNQEEQLADEVNLKKKKKINPQVFEEEIERIKSALNKYENLTHKTKEEFEQSYTGRHSNWNAKIKELKLKYPELINSGTSAENIRKHFADAFNEVDKTIEKFSKSITKELNLKLQESGKKFQEEHKITIPKVDLDAIENEASKTAYKKEDVIEEQTKSYEERRWYTLWLYKHTVYYTERVKTGERDVFDDDLYVGNLKSSLIDEFYKIVNDLPNKSKEVLQSYLSNFEKNIKDVIDERKNALEKEIKKKQSNDELIREINELEIKKKSIQPVLKRAEEIMEDLK
ncbi:MAG: dynamin family protein [Melioribacteraceae bacterium]|nr:dynamin family protein [Melioribacteraceae bacterium]